jgi:hypothetical protein
MALRPLFVLRLLCTEAVPPEGPPEAVSTVNWLPVVVEEEVVEEELVVELAEVAVVVTEVVGGGVLVEVVEPDDTEVEEVVGEVDVEVLDVVVTGGPMLNDAYLMSNGFWCWEYQTPTKLPVKVGGTVCL